MIIKDGENRFKIKESGKTQRQGSELGSDVGEGGRDDKKRTSDGRQI